MSEFICFIALYGILIHLAYCGPQRHHSEKYLVISYHYQALHLLVFSFQ